MANLVPPPKYSSFYLDPPMEKAPRLFAMDPVTLIINECNVIVLAMRRTYSWNSGSVASLLGSGDFFGGNEPFADLSSNLASAGQQRGGTLHGPKDNGGPLQQSFLRLRSILSETKDLSSVDSLTLLQPFMLTIESSSMSGTVTALALNTVSKLLHYKIVTCDSANFPFALVQLTTSLTHCRFEASDQNTDDSVLLKVIRLLETIVVSPLSSLLPNAVMSEIIHTCLSLACNKRRSEVLRRASEMAMISITIRVFQRVRELKPETSKGEEDIPANFAELNSEVIGGDSDDITMQSDIFDPSSAPDDVYRQPPARRLSHTVDLAPKSPRKPSSNDVHKPQLEEQFDIQCINEFLGFLISMISPSNQFEHMESSRVFALSLINTALEVSGDVIPQHPSLMALVADPVSKDVLQIMSSTDLPALLQAALRLFCSMVIILKPNLKSQNELTFNLLFDSILPQTTPGGPDLGPSVSVSLKFGTSKEIIIEHISFLWLRSPTFFTELFVDFDCDFEKSDLTSRFLEFLCTLALPEYANLTTDSVPPICLDGVRSFVAGVYERIKKEPLQHLPPSVEHEQILANKMRKKSFINCTELFNEKASRGVEALYNENFLKDPNDKKELAEFFFQKSTRLNKKVLGIYLSNPNNKDLLSEFMHMFDFSGLRVDEGLRIMLKAFRLPGESQQIERVVETFADAFVASQNSDDGGMSCLKEGEEPVVLDSSAVFLLSYSIIMLNTDLHNPQVKRHMDLDDYERNVSGAHSFPRWYLETMYNSIKDREIVMPEEHHGTEKWFDDVWHNLISSQSKYAREHSILNMDLSSLVISHFDKLIFETVADKILETLLEVISGAEDDVIITKVMSSIEKCAQICTHYNMDTRVNKLLEVLAKFTGLAKLGEGSGLPGDISPRSIIPTTQVKVAGEEANITVSDMAITFGRNYKAQLSFHVLFSMIKNSNTKISQSWDPVIKIILTLFENCLIEPNLFTEFQKLLKLPSLAKVKAQHESNTPRANEEFGFISSFSSFLRSYADDVPEPTHENIEHTKLTINLIKLVKVSSVFEAVSKRDASEMELFVATLLKNLPSFSEETLRFYESEIMFLFEVAVCFALIVNGQVVIKDVGQSLLKHFKDSHLSKNGEIRLMTYYFLLVRQSEEVKENEVQECIQDLLKIEPTTLKNLGESLILPLISLADNDSLHRNLIHSQSFWDLLKDLATNPANAEEVLTFVSSIIEKTPKDIAADNFVTLLGLLDEFSSLGAIYAHYEQGKLKDENEDDKKKAYEIVQFSKMSLTLTHDLGNCYCDQFDVLLQAFAHQCFNPCREVRVYAMQLLRTTLLCHSAETPENAAGIFDFVLFPLLAELEKELVLDTDKDGFHDTQLQVLSLLSKSFLALHDKLDGVLSETIWTGVLRAFKVFDQLNINSAKYKIFKEQSLEDMKNMILVLQNDFLRPSKTELWSSTWKELDVLFPTLKEEVTPQLQSQSESEPVVDDVASGLGPEVESLGKPFSEMTTESCDIPVESSDLPVEASEPTAEEDIPAEGDTAPTSE